MRSQPDFLVHCTELLAGAGDVRTKRMFGGYGLYVDDVFVAIVLGEALYLKVDAQTQPAFEAAGGDQFKFTRQGKLQSTSFWSAPPEAMDSPALMQPWVRLALGAALRARTASPRRR